MPKSRWAIQSTRVYARHSDGTPIEHVSYFKKQYVFNVYSNEEEAMTWPRKVDAVGYMRRVLGCRPGVDGYEVVRLG